VPVALAFFLWLIVREVGTIGFLVLGVFLVALFL
jgi:hypothetical protein